MDLHTYKVIAHVKLHEPLASDDGKPMIAYYRLYVVAASSPEAAADAVALDVAEDGTLDQSDLSVAQTDLASLDPAIRQSCPGRQASGIWYRSGRGFHD